LQQRFAFVLGFPVGQSPYLEYILLIVMGGCLLVVAGVVDSGYFLVMTPVVLAAFFIRIIARSP
jgi:hypothetical protein